MKILTGIIFKRLKKRGEDVHVHAMKAHRGAEIWLNPFLTSALDGSEWSALSTCHFTPWNEILVAID
jgi:hypothetical protein